MSNMYYQQWFIKNCVRLPGHLTAPPLHDLETLDLPKQSILHYTTTSPIENGPLSDEFIFRNIKRPIMMSHVVENGDSKGNPRRLAISSDTIIRTYHIRHRRFRLMKNLEAASRDPSSMIVYNYGIIPKIYRYMRSVYTNYYKWWNLEAAVWKNINKVSELVDRNHFIICNIPTILPSISDLRLATKSMTQKTIKLFNNGDSLIILEIWKWLGESRKESLLNNISIDKLDKVNIIFQESGKYTAINLGRLNKWRVATKEELEENPKANEKGLQAKLLQLRFLRLMMAIFQTRTMAISDETKVVIDSDIVVKKDAVPDIGSDNVAEVSVDIEDVQNANMDVEDEEIHHDEDLHKQIESDLEELDNISKKHYGDMNDEGEVVQEPIEVVENTTLEAGVMSVCDNLADDGLLSAAEYKKFNTLSNSYKNIVAPNGKETLDKFIKIDPKVLVIEKSHEFKDIPTVLDKSMLKSSLHDFDKKYIEHVLKKDVANMVMGIQNAGIAVTDYNVEHVEDVMGSYDYYTVKVNPVVGAPSIFRYKLPTIETDGSWVSGCVKYTMRRQRGDLPIRKIAPDSVALTSYYGKTFVERSSKKVNNYGQWLNNNIMAIGLDDADDRIVKLYPNNVFDNDFKAPRVYSILAHSFRGFSVNTNITGNVAKYNLSFDYSKREELYGKEAIAAYEEDGNIIIGINETTKNKGTDALSTNIYLVMDKNGSLYTGSNGDLVDLCNIEELLGLDSSKAPVDHAELKVMGREIPIGIILGYRLGLSKLIQLLRVIPRRVNSGTRVNLDDNEYSLVFEDETLVFSKDDKKASIILSGFNEYYKAISNYGVYDFDKPGVYLNVLETGGASTKYLREIDLMYQMFIDPITKELLIEMKEPTSFHGLLIRSSELLLDDAHPNELDPESMRIKGYERISGIIYNELVKSIRGHNGKPGKDNKTIDLNPYAVWMAIRQDSAVTIVNEINPIQNLKEAEAVTFTGMGGRNSRSMVKHTRMYQRKDMGTISESTVDSSDVAINTFTSADPQFTSLRGMSKRYEVGKTGATALLSTSALISPCSDRDDPKRVSFISIQQAHVVACKGYGQAAVRTGYEQVLAQRTSDIFATSALHDGIVKQITDTGIIVEYKDGDVKGYELGRRYGSAAGLTIPHSVITEMKVGQKFKEGDIICYNNNFFEKDILNPTNIVWKAGITVKTALMESTATLDDCSAISAKTAELLTTKTTKVKNVIVDFKQNIHNLLKVGTEVESEDILCMIEDPLSSEVSLFDKESLDTLRMLSAMSPQTKAKGRLEKIEIYYHGDIEDMSMSLREICNSTNRDLAKHNKSVGKKVFTGKVDENFRIEGEALAIDTANIRFYITGDVSAGVGDRF